MKIHGTLGSDLPFAAKCTNVCNAENRHSMGSGQGLLRGTKRHFAAAAPRSAKDFADIWFSRYKV